METDIVGVFIETKKAIKELEEKLAALEVVLFNNPELVEDPRIKISAPRKTILITDECYDLLSKVGEETFVVEQRRKKLEEFDIDTQKIILGNPKNYIEKLSKPSVRIK